MLRRRCELRKVHERSCSFFSLATATGNPKYDVFHLKKITEVTSGETFSTVPFVVCD